MIGKEIMVYFHIHICCQAQRLNLYLGQKLYRAYVISTAKLGTGQQQGSYQTPQGKHFICEKIGDGLPINTVFVARKPTGEILTDELAVNFPDRDWIITRILRLRGLEKGYNVGGKCDTYARFIYIHGTPETAKLGSPSSHGCIRMHNLDLIELFGYVKVGTEVMIE